MAKDKEKEALYKAEGQRRILKRKKRRKELFLSKLDRRQPDIHCLCGMGWPCLCGDDDYWY